MVSAKVPLEAKRPRISRRKMDIVKVLFDSPNGLVVRKIARRVDVDIRYAYENLRLFERLGLVIRQYEVSERNELKVLKYSLTEYGRAVAADCLAAANGNPQELKSASPIPA